MNVLFVGDIVGKPGRRAIRDLLPSIVNEHNADIVIANGENAAGGYGITVDAAQELFGRGIDLLTSGNHIWDKKDIYDYLDSGAPLIRPGNYPPGNPGKSMWTLTSPAGEKITVINALGRVFMANVDCPFRFMDDAVDEAKKRSEAIILDFHAEVTSEKNAMGKYLDGRVSATLGTHTHVQTADERVSANGSAYITDLGMTGATNSIIGMRAQEPLQRFITGVSGKYQVAKGDIELQGALLEIDCATGKAVSIQRIKKQLI